MVYLHEGRLQSVTGVRARYYSYTKLVVILGFPYHQITDLLVKQVQLKPYTALMHLSLPFCAGFLISSYMAVRLELFIEPR